MDKIRAAFYAKGYSTIRSLGTAFKHFDQGVDDRKLTREELADGLRSFNIELQKSELEAIFTLLDTNKDGSVNFDEFLIGIRGKPNEKRQAVIDQAFIKFDKDKSGFIAPNDLVGVYNCKFHPDVKAKKKTEEQVFKEFLRCFGDVDMDGQISKKEWDDYYAAVSSSIDHDGHFVELMKAAWKL